MAHHVDKVLGFVPRKLEPDEYKAVVASQSDDRAKLPEDRDIPYVGRPAHLNHPCTIWVRSSEDNYSWAFNYMCALEYERKHRNPNGVPVHKAYRLACKKLDFPRHIKQVGQTPHALAMKAMAEERPDLYYPDDAIRSYRNFYCWDKVSFASWKTRNKPDWWKDDI